MNVLPHLPRSVASQFELAGARPGTVHCILWTALEEWSFFGGQTQYQGYQHRGHREADPGYYQRVGTYWRYGTNQALDGRNTDVPWSATFISYVMRTAGVSTYDFHPATAHSRYIHDAILHRLNGSPANKFVAWRLTEYRPKEGDLVCYWRKHPKTYEQASHERQYESHTDIVVYVAPEEIGVIGGNVSDSVTLSILRLGGAGFLTKDHHLFAVMENRLPLR
jgi:hypothetical protein